MLRSFLIVTASLLLCSPFPIGLAHGRDIETLSLKIADEMDARDKAVVSVLDFTNLDGDATDLGLYLSDEIANILVNLEDGFDVVDRSVLDEILKDASFADAVSKTPALMRQIGTSTGVEVLVLGSIAPFRDRVRVNIRMLDTAAEKMVWGSTANIKPDPEIKELLARETRAPGSKKKKSVKPPPRFNNRYLQFTVTSMGISPKYKTAVVGLLVENISKEDVKIALRPPSDPIYLVESSATLVDDRGVRCQGAETSGIKTEAFSLLTAQSSTVILISFNCETVPAGEFATVTADFFAEAHKDRADFSMGIPNIQIAAFNKQGS